MVSRDITFTDYDGTQKTDKFWFNLTPADVQDLNLEIPGGLESVTKDLETDPNIVKILKTFKMIILKAYGVRTPDKKFYKDEIETKAFAASDAFSQLFLDFMNNSSKDDVVAFISAMFPQGMDIAKAAKAAEEGESSKIAGRIEPQDHKKPQQ